MRWVTSERSQGGLGGIDYPLLSDVTKEISTKYQALINHGPNKGVSTRATFIIDKKGVLRHM
jgi:peroxiredoxin (alkyl hydroperoxide reductase subunit C)